MIKNKKPASPTALVGLAGFYEYILLHDIYW